MKVRPIIIIVISLAAVLAMNACVSSPAPVEKTLFVAPQMVDCPGTDSQQCLQVKENPGDEYTLTFESIVGFEFLPGYEYKLRVVEESTAGASEYQWRLIELISKTPVYSPLKNTQWDLSRTINAQDQLADVLPETQVTLEFTDGKLSGSAGCNSYFGDYRSDASSLTIGSIASTEMYCTSPEGVMEQESAYLSALMSAASYTIDGKDLTITNTDGETILIFSVLQPIALTGETWEMVSISDGQGEVVPALAGTLVTAIFSQDGTLSGSAGCNNYGSTYAVDGEEMTITAPAATLMYCAEPQGVMEQESTYLTALESTASYRIQQGTLELYDTSGALLVRFRVYQPSLADTSWTLTDLSPAANTVATTIAGTLITANFGKDGVLNGLSGCNQYSADYQIDGNMLAVGSVISTKMFCSEPDGIMDQENTYLANLQSAATYEISGDFLQIMDENERLLLSFQQAKKTSSSLAGTSWMWREFQSSADEVFAPSNPDKYTLTFKEGDVVEIQADCNFIDGIYHAEDSYLTILPETPGPALCSPGSLSDRFLQLVGDSSTYLITESGELAISILYDSGILFFKPVK